MSLENQAIRQAVVRCMREPRYLPLFRTKKEVNLLT